MSIKQLSLSNARNLFHSHSSSSFRLSIIILIIIIIIIIIFLIILVLYKYSKYSKYFKNEVYIETFNGNKNIKQDTTSKWTIWMYWEYKKPKTSSRPIYLDICYETVIKHCSSSFKIQMLDEISIHKFLPGLRNDLDDKLTIPQKTDYYRYELLRKYGGIWLDTDIIVMKDLKPIADLLNNGYSYIGAGCHGNKCRPNGFPKPANWFMASLPEDPLVSRCIKKCDKLLDTYDTLKEKYFILGRETMWDEIDYLLKNMPTWRYYHLDSICTERDSNDKKYVNARFLSNENNDPKCSNKQLFIPVYNTAPGFPDWFKSMSREKILESSNTMLISKLFRESLDMN